MNLSKKKILVTTMIVMVLMAGVAANAYAFKEYSIGEEKIVKKMKIAAIYFQSVPMEPESKAGLGPEESDIHLEADINAVMNNPYGFGFGAWIPYLTVDYKLKNLDTGETQEGSFMPMAASDGAHYGSNIKMMGIGNYKVTYIIHPPGNQDFLQHVDDETGPEKRFWKKPIKVSWEFTYNGDV